jgi:hypothetical protein
MRLFHDLTKNKHAAIWLSALLFSLIHVRLFSFLPILVLGALLGYLLVWSRSIWVPVIAHFINNGLIVTYYYLSAVNKTDSDLENIGGTNQTLYLAIISIFLMAGLIWLFRKTQVKTF